MGKFIPNEPYLKVFSYAKILFLVYFLYMYLEEIDLYSLLFNTATVENPMQELFAVSYKNRLAVKM